MVNPRITTTDNGFKKIKNRLDDELSNNWEVNVFSTLRCFRKNIVFGQSFLNLLQANGLDKSDTSRYAT